MKKSESFGLKRRRPSGVSVWYIVGGAALVAVAAGLFTSLHDIRRYMKIRSM